MNREKLRDRLIERWMFFVKNGMFASALRYERIIRKYFILFFVIIASGCAHQITAKIVAKTLLMNANTLALLAGPPRPHVPYYLWATGSCSTCVHKSFDLDRAVEECSKHEFCKVTRK